MDDAIEDFSPSVTARCLVQSSPVVFHRPLTSPMQARSSPLPDKEMFWLRILRGPRARAERAPAIIHRLMTSPILARPMTRPEFNENLLVFDDFLKTCHHEHDASATPGALPKATPRALKQRQRRLNAARTEIYVGCAARAEIHTLY